MEEGQGSQPAGEEALDWHFLQCFGERTPGEEIQEGTSCSPSPGLVSLMGLACHFLWSWMPDGPSAALCADHSPGMQAHSFSDMSCPWRMLATSVEAQGCRSASDTHVGCIPHALREEV